MTAKEYLRQVRRLRVTINGKRERILQLRSIAESINRPLDEMPNRNQGRDRMAIVDLIVDFTREITEDTEKLVAMEKSATSIINRIPRPEYRAVLELYYLNGNRWEDISVKMCYSERQVYRFHQQALKAFEELM